MILKSDLVNKKICIAYTHHKLGDLVWQLPYIKAISDHHNQNVDLILREKTQAKNILKDLKYINNINYNNFRKGIYYWIDVWKLLKIFNQNNYSHLYILDKVNKPAIAAKLSGIKNIIGPGIGNQKKYLTTDIILSDDDWKLNYSEQSQKLLKLHKINIDNPYPQIDVDIKRFNENNPDLLFDGKKIAFGVDSFEDYKMWYEEDFVKLADLLYEKKLFDFFKNLKPLLYKECEEISSNMTKRGGGIIDIELIDKTTDIPNYYQLNATFDTVDSMGANFINSSLEQFAKTLIKESNLNSTFSKKEKNIEVIMSILSNYVPECLVRAEVSCSIEELSEDKEFNGNKFAQKFFQAIQIAKTQTVRAVTHNKGIMNGVDSVVIATGNDFRAVEAGVHAYASKDGKYSSLTHCSIDNNEFCFWLEIPLALGTVGGLNSLHPLVKFALQMLGKPSAKDLMKIVAVAGLAQNFAALKSLTTTGIQQGHMKMHLMNILNQFEANETEKKQLIDHFKKNTVTHSAVVEAIEKLRA